jgi:hypothetical protein
MVMGNLDAIELQILEMLIPVGNAGRNFGLPNLHQDLAANNRRLAKLSLNEADEQIISALVDLVERNCIYIRHYIDNVPRRREGSETPELFYRGTFTCIRAIPNALKRKEDLIGRDKYGVFISHSVSEARLATAMKTFLFSALGSDYPVFVSSDLVSIQSGKPWFSEIVKAVETSKAVLVLITPQSVDQRWINFEAGIGVGAGAAVIPMLACGMTKGSLGLPLNQLQARDLSDSKDISGMIKDFEEIIGGHWSNEAEKDLFIELRRLSGELDAGVTE